MMKEKRIHEILLILLLILAVCTPLIYATIAVTSTWVIGIIIAWILLGAIYVSLALLAKWK
ncbi:MAG: hypothetical protein DRN59_00470 [Thaumarchaeota archaeon]|nr:MAG: hypothetical protein DRN59_00470 [Nitrososphaerota archaeon]